MNTIGWLARARSAALAVALSLALSGCFDLAQRVSIDRDGSGHYQIAITAQGIVGEALKEKPVTLDAQKSNHVATATTEKNGRVTQVSTVAFAKLSDLKLSDEAISLHVMDRSFFGLGPTHVRFRRTFLVNNARRDNQGRVGGSDDEVGSQIMASVFGDHTYVFAVSVPGSILSAAPVKLGDAVVTPTITGDFYHGHIVTWTMPLYQALGQKMLTFQVDFSAWGSFADAQTTPESASSL
jgi:hypothetical protein